MWIVWNLAAAIVAGAVGVVLWLLGRRGWRIDDHPVCRRCGYDLTGGAGCATACPECGADLSRRRAVRHGNRRGGRTVRTLAGLLVLAGLVGCVAFTWAALETGRYDRVLPAWVLTLKLRTHQPAVERTAAAELCRRMGVLSQAQVRAAADAMLDLQDDPRRAWSNVYGTFLDTAMRRPGVLTVAQRARYGRQGLIVTWRVRPEVRAGDPVPIEVATVRTDRMEWTRQPCFSARCVALTIDGTPVAVSDDEGLTPLSLFLFTVGGSPVMHIHALMWWTAAQDRTLRAMGVGDHQVGAVLQWAGDRDAAAVVGRPPGNVWNAAIRFEQTVSWRVHVVPAARRTVRRITGDAALRRRVRGQIALGSPGVIAHGEMGPGFNGPPVQVALQPATGRPALPVALTFAVWLDDPRTDRHWRIGQYVDYPGGSGYFMGEKRPPPGSPGGHVFGLPGFDVRRVDLRLEPDAARARQTVDVDRIWGEPVVFKGVPVRWFGHPPTGDGDAGGGGTDG